MSFRKRPANQNSQTVLISALSFCILLAVMPLLGAFSPRAMAMAPGMLAVMGLAGLWLAARGPFPLPEKSFLVPAIGVLALGGIGILWALDSAESLERLAKLAPLIAMGILLPGLAARLPERALKTFLWLFPVMTLLAASFLAFELYFDAPYYLMTRGVDEYGEFNYSNLNRGTICVVFALLVAMPFLFHAPLVRRQKTILLAALALIVAALAYKTQSQSSQLALIVGFIFMVAFPYGWRAAWVGIGVLMVLGTLGAPWIAQGLYQNFVAEISNTPWMQSGYPAERLEIWDFVARYALQNPFYGFGIEATRSVEAFDTSQIYRQGATVLHPHNFALQIWIEFGAIGVVLFSGLIGFVVYRISCFPTAQARLALPAFMGLMSVSATAYGMWQGWWVGLVFILIAYIVVSQRALMAHK